MKKKQKRRSSYLTVPEGVELARSPAIVRGYDKAGRFVCRLEITSAGIAVFAGGKGQKFIHNLSWEQLVRTLEKSN
jgi:hypothetical protein